MRFRWSRGSVLDFGTQFRGFEVGYGFFRAKKILSTPFFGGEVKPSVPCRGSVACKRSLKKAWKSLLSAKFVGNFSPNSSTSRYWDLWRRCDLWETPGGAGWNVQRLRVYNKPAGCSIYFYTTTPSNTTRVYFYCAFKCLLQVSALSHQAWQYKNHLKEYTLK